MKALDQNIHAYLLQFLDGKALINLARTGHFLNKLANEEKFWKILVGKEFTVNICNSYKTIYRQAYWLKAIIQQALTKKMTNQAWNNLFLQIINLGCEKLLEIVPISKININNQLSKSSINNTYLHIAAFRGYPLIVQFLLQHKASIDAVDAGYCINMDKNISSIFKFNSRVENFGTTPLARAASRGHHHCVKVLIEHKTSINYQSRDKGKSALHEAAEFGHEKCINLLIEAKADLYLKTHLGFYPYEVAKHNYHKTSAELIKKHMNPKSLSSSCTIT